MTDATRRDATSGTYGSDHEKRTIHAATVAAANCLEVAMVGADPQTWCDATTAVVALLVLASRPTTHLAKKDAKTAKEDLGAVRSQCARRQRL